MNSYMIFTAFVNFLFCANRHEHTRRCPQHNTCVSMIDSCDDLLIQKSKMRNWFAKQVTILVGNIYGHKLDRAVEKALKLIYDQLGDDFSELLLFVSNAMVNTKGFTVFTQGNENCDGKWIARGVLALSGERFYQDLTKVTGDCSWVLEPQNLGNLSTLAVLASTMYWSTMLEHKMIDFYTVMRTFYPNELAAKDLCHSREKRILAEKTRVYDCTTRFFKTSPVWGLPNSCLLKQ